MAGTSGSTDKYGGYWNKTRSTVDLGGFNITCRIIHNRYIPHQKSESPSVMPYQAIPDSTVPTGSQWQARVYTRPRLSRLSSVRYERHTKGITVMHTNYSQQGVYLMHSWVWSYHQIWNKMNAFISLQSCQQQPHALDQGSKVLAFK